MKRLLVNDDGQYNQEAIRPGAPRYKFKKICDRQLRLEKKLRDPAALNGDLESTELMAQRNEQRLLGMTRHFKHLYEGTDQSTLTMSDVQRILLALRLDIRNRLFEEQRAHAEMNRFEDVLDALRLNHTEGRHELIGDDFTWKFKKHSPLFRLTGEEHRIEEVLGRVLENASSTDQ